MTEGAAKVTYKRITSFRFDTAKFKKGYPELFNEYTKTTEYKRFTVL